MAGLREGDRINNYILERPLGTGSFGEVWRARHHMFGDAVAIKIPTDADYVRNLQREGVAIHGLRHPNIVRAIDLDPYADPPYLVMECVDGPSVRAAIDKFGRTFPVPAAIAIMRGLLHALTAAHAKSVLHRDIKPANILLAHPMDGLDSISEQAVRVTDFGLGRVGGQTTQSIMQSGSFLEDDRGISGTMAYMSPEQKEGRELDGRSDLYSCGIVLFEMLTGERPQGNDRPSQLRDDVPDWLDHVFERSYTRWERRFSCAVEMLESLTPSGRPAYPPPPPVGRHWVSGAARHACPDCGTSAMEDDQFCIRCGRQIVASVPRCPNAECRVYVHATDRFCILCGTNLQVLTE